MLASLAFPLAANDTDAEERLAQLNQFRDMDEDVAAAADNEQRVTAVQSLFRGKKVFLNREVPREMFCFLLRCCGAEVSWDATAAGGDTAPFPETDPAIEYHVIDRPVPADAALARFFVQPQFVADCVNAARLLPVKDYLPGTRLIPHLSPFADYTKGYVPAEYRYLQGELDADALYDDEGEGEGDEEETAVEEREDDEEDDDEDDDEGMEVDEDDEEEEVEEIEEEPVKAPVKNSKRNKAPARISKEQLDKQIADNKEIKLREMSLPKKRINLYNKMKHAEKKEKATVETMKEKRREVNKKRRASARK